MWQTLLVIVTVTFTTAVSITASRSPIINTKRSMSLPSPNSLALIKTPELSLIVYYEAMCPDSRYFLLKQLVPVWRRLKKHISVDFVPFGKAFNSSQNGLRCHHGPPECRAHLVHVCALSNLNDSQRVEMIECLMRDNLAPPNVALQECNDSLNSLDPSQVDDCVQGAQGPMLMNEMAARTRDVWPLRSVPLVTLQGKRIRFGQDDQNLLIEICRHLKKNGIDGGEECVPTI